MNYSLLLDDQVFILPRITTRIVSAKELKTLTTRIVSAKGLKQSIASNLVSNPVVIVFFVILSCLQPCRYYLG